MNAMAERKIPSPSPNRIAMSRALGAAFLNHQVEELEKSVSANGPSSGNWRDRRQMPHIGHGSAPMHNGIKHVPMSPGIKVVHRRKPGDAPSNTAKDTKPVTREAVGGGRPMVETVKSTKVEVEKFDRDADVIVVDASVLVHALYQVKKWCRDGRREIIIVPLEALNTLDLLKKGTSPLAQRARAASRILEAQVGTNPRIRVQRDDAFVLWDKITADVSSEEEGDAAKAATPSPEWLRRTICCAQWEVEHADATIQSAGNGRVVEIPEKPKNHHQYKVALAILSSPPNMSPVHNASKSIEGNEVSMNPVPLPAPSVPHLHKFEARSSGVLVARWAEKAKIRTISVEPTLPGRGGGVADEDERPKRIHNAHHGPKGRRSSNTDHTPKASLVERPPAVMAMMEMVSQPSRVVRVLARGERLEPGP